MKRGDRESIKQLKPVQRKALDAWERACYNENIAATAYFDLIERGQDLKEPDTLNALASLDLATAARRAAFLAYLAS